MDIYAVNFGTYGNTEVQATGRYDAIRRAADKLGLKFPKTFLYVIASTRKLTPSKAKRRVWNEIKNTEGGVQ